MKVREILASLSVILILVGVPILVYWYQDNRVLGQYGADTRTITLTGVAKDGAWTLNKVDNTNYWRTKFEPAILYLTEGEKIALRLTSCDVHHRFYVPTLGIGPIDVEPGHVETVQFAASKLGVHKYYCTSMCGDCHFYMQGWIVITAPGEASSPPDTLPLQCRHDYEPPDSKDIIPWGNYLYQKLGCTTCHGENGEGGIENTNYAKEAAPAHKTIADSLFLREEEDAETFVELLINRTDLDNMEEEPDIPLFSIVLTQFNAAKQLIVEGKHCAKMDPDGPEPPLQMPAWQDMLTDRDVDAIMAYLITLYEWEDDEDFEDDTDFEE